MDKVGRKEFAIPDNWDLYHYLKMVNSYDFSFRGIRSGISFKKDDFEQKKSKTHPHGSGFIRTIRLFTTSEFQRSEERSTSRCFGGRKIDPYYLSGNFCQVDMHSKFLNFKYFQS